MSQVTSDTLYLEPFKAGFNTGGIELATAYLLIAWTSFFLQSKAMNIGDIPSQQFIGLPEGIWKVYWRLGLCSWNGE